MTVLEKDQDDEADSAKEEADVAEGVMIPVRESVDVFVEGTEGVLVESSEVIDVDSESDEYVMDFDEDMVR